MGANVLEHEIEPRGPRQPVAYPSSRGAAQESPASPLLLHGAFAANGLVLWGETRAASCASPSPSRRSQASVGPRARPGQNQPSFSPYDAGGEVLLTAIRAAGISTAGCRTRAAAISLPSLEQRPAASSPLVAEAPENSAELVLRQWLVTTVALRGSRTIDFLAACAGRRTLAPGVVIADDLAYWVNALRLAGALVARQHFLPDVVREGGEFVARWRPVPSHAESRELAQFAASMPEACRAIGADPAGPNAPAAVVLSAFVEHVVDQLVRSAQAGPRASPRPAALFDSVDEQWMAALIQPEGRLEGDAAALEQLRRRVQDWWRPVTLNAASPFGLCFRLEEPAGALPDADRDGLADRIAPADGSWRIRYLLQAHHDPSLLLLAGEAWSARGPAAKLLRGNGFDVREYLLQSLGEAARLCPLVEESLRGAMPDGVEIDAAGAVGS